MLSTRHQWFPCGPLLVSHLTRFFPGLFLLCSRPWLLPTAAEGGLEPTPVSRFRGTFPHRLSSYTLRGPFGPLCARGAQSSGKTQRAALRVLKTYIARELFRAMRNAIPLKTSGFVSLG